MTKDALRILDLQIIDLQNDLNILTEARDVVARRSQASAPVDKPARKKRRKAVKPKKAKKRARKAAPAPASTDGEPDDFGAEVNGTFVKMTAREAAVFDLLNAAPQGEVVSIESIAEIANGLSNARAEISRLRKKLYDVNATIAVERGRGYRLEVISED